MQQAYNHLSQELKATKRAHRLFLSVLKINRECSREGETK
ncbi:hypothetical protein NHP190002_15040 [Helicobacter ailurogastricus]|nr:hypothetical protein NHP190002_15040 [Helicobacter ailurogastricus]